MDSTTPAFITGSKALASDSGESDVDLVVLVDQETKEKLIGLSDLGKLPCRYGGKTGLNLILCTSSFEYVVWRGALRVCADTQNDLGRKLTKLERLAIYVKVFADFGFQDYFEGPEPSCKP